MKLTQEEAVELLCYGDWLNVISEHIGKTDTERIAEAMSIVGKAFHPISREQLKKALDPCGWETVPDEGFVDTMGRQVYSLHCPHCDFYWRETGHARYFRFCPACGAPMTEEAVDIMLKRLDGLRDQ